MNYRLHSPLSFLPKGIAPIGIYSIAYIGLYILMYLLGIIDTFPFRDNLMQWDAWWYRSIVDQGYIYKSGEQCNLAFYPLFPIVWKITGFSALGISLLNLVFMFAGMLILHKALKLDHTDLLLMLSVPSLFFCYVPYSEALFFLGVSLIIHGLKRNTTLTIFGICIACLTRSASMILIPAVLFAKILCYQPEKQNKKLILDLSLMILAATASTILVQAIQYKESGKFFAFFEVQQSWDRFLRLPEFYLTTWGGKRLVWLDGLAFFTGLLAAVFCVSVLFRKIKSASQQVSPGIALSAGYLALVTLSTLLYSGRDALGGTSIFSLNRFVFATPFFTVFLVFCLKKLTHTKKQILLFLAISIFNWILFGLHGQLRGQNFIETKIYFIVVVGYSLAYLYTRHKSYGKYIRYSLIFLNLMAQIYLFNQFITGKWVG